MAETEKEITVVDDLGEAMRAKRPQPQARAGRGAKASDAERAQEGAGQDAHVGLAAALGREIYTWTSPFAEPPVVVNFRRPPGGTQEMVARVLGPEQSANAMLVREYKALASIIEINGALERQPRTIATFNALKQRVGWVGPGDDEWLDEPLAMFVFAYECAMYPDQLQMAADLSGAGLSPDDEKRILLNAGLERPKA